MKKFLLAILLPLLITASAYAKVFVLTSPPAGVSNVPVVTNSGNVPTFTTGGAAIPGDSAVTLTCGCTTITGATVQITGGAFTNDALNFTNIFSITGSFAGTTMTLSGSDTVAHYQTALQSVTYSSINADPTNGGANPTRTLSWIATSSAGSSNTGISTLNVVSSQPAPVLGGGGNSVTYTSGGAAVTVDSSLTVSAGGSTMTGATASITSGLLNLDSLNFTNQFSITGSFNSGSGVLTLSGSDTLAHYQTAMRTITYSSTAADPTNAGADVSRTVTWRGINGPNSSNTVASTITVQNPAQPSLSSVGNTVSYTSGGSAATLDNAIIVSCTCTTLTGGTVAVTGGGTIAPQDVLAATVGATAITASYNATTGVLTLSGTDTLANYQTVMRTIAYSSSATDATNGGVNPTRTFTWVATNSTTNSTPATTFANVFVGGGQPSWVNTGAFVAFNPGTQQCWINGSGTTGISSCLQDTRATQETCVNGATVTYAAPNVLCATAAGMQVLPAYTNVVTQSNNQANGAWIHFTTGSGTVATTANSAVAPDGNTTATKLVVQRTSTGAFGDNAMIIDNGFGLAQGANSFSIWLKADGVGDVGKVVNLYVLNGGTLSYTLTSTWTNVQLNNVNFASACLITSGNCQFGIGFSGASSNNQTGTVNIDTWGAEINTGPLALPTIATTTASANSAADNITGLSPITAVMGSSASSILTSVTGALGSQVAEVLDSNGSAIMEENAVNQLATVLGTPSNTSNSGTWTGTVTLGYARDSTGRTFGLNGGVVVRDGTSTTVSTPLTFGASNTGTNILTGNIGITNMYNIRIADSLIGSPGTGTKYYFAAAGNDANPCTLAAPCASITKANSLSIVTNDQINFNGGDTFTGCLSYSGSSNWNASRSAPATIQSYGTGQATITPNCTAANSQIGILNLTSTDGVVVNNLRFLGDSAGNAAYGIFMKNCDHNNTHGNVTIQNNTFNGINNAAALNFYTADIIVRGADTCPGGQTQMMDHLVALNNTANGATTTSTDSPFMSQPGFTCQMEWDAIQGNLIFNIGGIGQGPAYLTGTGIGFDGACPLGSTPSGGAATNAGPSGIIQFNVVHDDGANAPGAACGFYNIWTSATDSAWIRANETYNAKGTGGCDHGAFDLDISTTNSIVERNYSHNDWGPCITFFQGSSSTARWNICDGDGQGSGGTVFSQAGGALGWVYNNVLATAANSQNNFVASYNGCPAAGSLFANNIVINRTTSFNTQFFSIGTQNAVGQCTPAPIGGLKLANNDWYAATRGAGNFSLWTTTNNQNGSVCCSSTTTYAAMATLTGETGGMSVNPQFSNPYQNTTCNSVVGSPGPQASGCPAGFTLSVGSPMAAPAGATLTSAPYNLPTTIGGTANKWNGQGTLSYYGTTLPCSVSGGGSGYPIGADCGNSAAPPPSFSLDFTTGTLPSCSGCNVTFTGGTGASYYTSANVLHINNAANNPRFDHNPANGAVLGLLYEPAKTQHWSSTIMTAGNTNSSDLDHAQFFGNPGPCLNGTQTTTAYCGVWGVATEAIATGPDNVALSAGNFHEDNCPFGTTGQTCSSTPNVTDGGHASLNAILPGTQGSTPFAGGGSTYMISEYIRRDTDSGDAGRGVTFYSADSGGNDCYVNFNVPAGSVGSPIDAPSSGYTCTNIRMDTINIAGNLWYRMIFASNETTIQRINTSLTTSGTNFSINYTGDNHSGVQVYGPSVIAMPAGITTICVPGTSGTVPCVSNMYISNTNVYNTVNTVADNLSFTVPAGLCALTFTFDDNSTQKVTLGGSCATASTSYNVPTNLNRPWFKTITGSAS